VGVDIGPEQVSFARDFLFSSAAKGGLGMSNILALDGFLYHRGAVTADFGYDPDVFEAGKGTVY